MLGSTLRNIGLKRSSLFNVPFYTRRTCCTGGTNAGFFARTRPQTIFPIRSITSTPLKWRNTATLGVGGITAGGQSQRGISTSRISFRQHYVPPRMEQSRFLGFLDKIPENTIFYGIIGLNAGVFVMWYMAEQVYKQERDPSNLIWMTENFTTSWKNLTSGRFWTPLTSCFSHQNLSHILFNGFTFYFMAQPVLSILGSRQFIFLYLGGGLVSSFTSGIWAKVTGKVDYSSHGASGAIFSIVTLLACVAPTMKFHLYGIIPVPAWLAVSGLFAYDLYSTVSEKSGNTDTMGHVGGVVAGALYFIGKRFRIL